MCSQMKESRFYRFSLVLPLAVPALMAPIVFFNLQLPTWLTWVVVYTTFSGIIGGVPYLILIGVLLWWARGKSDTQFKRALLLLPVLMLPVVVVLIVAALLVEAMLRPENALSLPDILLMLLELTPFILGFGYFYVLVVFFTAFILKRQGVLVPPQAV